LLKDVFGEPIDPYHLHTEEEFSCVLLALLRPCS